MNVNNHRCYLKAKVETTAVGQTELSIIFQKLHIKQTETATNAMEQLKTPSKTHIAVVTLPF